MISIDTNLLLYGLHPKGPNFVRAKAFLDGLADSDAVVICELVLLELYLLLRNPAVMTRPLDPATAAGRCQALRQHPRWQVVESAPVMERVWEWAARPGFARRRIVDVRLGLTLRHHGVTQLATRNVRDFEDMGFERVWDPLAASEA